MTILLSTQDRNRCAYWSDSFNYEINPYMESDQGKKNLVICYGDSWTWGDSLGNADARTHVEDTEFRVKNVYGARLAELIDADFVNVAYPGIFNYWIHDRLQILLNHDLPTLTKKYDKIYVIITLTELGREFDFDKYHDEFACNEAAEHILEKAEHFDFIKLKTFEDRLPNNVLLIVGRNFTTTFETNKKILKHLVPKNWTQTLFELQSLEVLDQVPLVSFGLGIFNDWVVKNKKNTLQYKEYMTNTVMPAAEKQTDLLNQSKYNYKKATKHPTPEGHQIWAEYLFNYLKEIK